MKTRKKMLTYNLPEDLIMEIMIRLPVKSLLRFKCVSKSWYALITDPSFIARQVQWSKSVTKNHCLKLISQDNYPVLPHLLISMISNKDDEPYVVQDLDLPFPKQDLMRISVYGQCNGIFCLRNGVQGLILWNPATKEVKPIPGSKAIHYTQLGFGIDPITRDYKVVHFSISPRKEQEPPPPPHHHLHHVQVYNLSTNSWRTIDVDLPNHLKPSLTRGRGSYLNGVYHWLALDLNNIDDKKLILSFDLSKEVFGVIHLPPEISSSAKKVHVVGESLACVCGRGDKEFEIWVMNEYGVESSWTKKFEIGPFPFFSSILGFWGDDKILVQGSYGRLVSYNLQNQCRKFKTCVLRVTSMFDYVESLVPLTNRGKRKRIS